MRSKKAAVGIVAGLAAVLLTANNCGKEPYIAPQPNPRTVFLPDRAPIEAKFVAQDREAKRQAGFVVPKGYTWTKIGDEVAEGMYGSIEALAPFRAYNESEGNLTRVRNVGVSDPFVDVNGFYGLNEFDWNRRPQVVHEEIHSILGAGDSLGTPKVLIGTDGTNHYFCAEVDDVTPRVNAVIEDFKTQYFKDHGVVKLIEFAEPVGVRKTGNSGGATVVGN